MARAEILSAEGARRMMSRLAYEVVERNEDLGELDVFGIRRRGYDVAEALAEHMQTIGNRDFFINDLDVTPYRDDRDVTPEESRSRVEADVTGRHVLLVDDVLFTGRTARAALDAVLQYGRPASIQLVVLIDRGHREYPIQPDYVGRVIPTKHRERVIVEAGEDFAVYLEE